MADDVVSNILCFSRSRFAETEYVMLDANFRLKNKDRKLVDPALGGASAYFVERDGYLNHVAASGAQTEVQLFNPDCTAQRTNIFTDQCLRLRAFRH